MHFSVFGLYFTALSHALTERASASTDVYESVCNAPLLALRDLSKYTPAQPGDRTLIDAIAPFCEALADRQGLEKATQNAREGAEGTRGMQARLGRATYINTSAEAPPDPGAWGVAALLEGFVRGLKG